MQSKTPSLSLRSAYFWQGEGRGGDGGLIRYFGFILVIFDPCMPIPAIIPFWLKMKA